MSTTAPKAPPDDQPEGHPCPALPPRPRASPTRPIDELLAIADSKYSLVIYAAKRARQINAYYSPARRGPARVRRPARRDPRAREAAVDRPARDQRRPADGREDRPGLTRPDPTDGPAVTPTTTRPRVVLGVGGGIAAYKVAELLRLLTESGHDVRVVPTAAALRVRRRAHLGGAVRPPGDHRRLGRRPRGAARPDRPAGRPRRRRAGHRRPARPGRARPGRRPAHQHPAHRPLPGR